MFIKISLCSIFKCFDRPRATISISGCRTASIIGSEHKLVEKNYGTQNYNCMTRSLKVPCVSGQHLICLGGEV
uniref:Uncharacterized protein n=1 Tax=Rhizophora mucronata TaxID=61149 RepID=A0A2P2KBR3_RHIMU